MEAARTLDLTLLDGYLDNLGLDVLGKMLALYEQQSALYIQAIEEAATEGSQSQWQECCHKMKGAAASSGLKLIYQRLAGIEKSTENVEWKKAQIIELKAMNVLGIACFRSWLNLPKK